MREEEKSLIKAQSPRQESEEDLRSRPYFLVLLKKKTSTKPRTVLGNPIMTQYSFFLIIHYVQGVPSHCSNFRSNFLLFEGRTNLSDLTTEAWSCNDNLFGMKLSLSPRQGSCVKDEWSNLVLQRFTWNYNTSRIYHGYVTGVQCRWVVQFTFICQHCLSSLLMLFGLFKFSRS